MRDSSIRRKEATAGMTIFPECGSLPWWTALGPGEATPVGLLKAGFLALGGYLLGDPGVKSGSRGLAARGGPVALLGHGLDQFLAGHGLAGFGQNLGSGVERAQRLVVGAGLLGSLGLGFLGTLRCCHDTSPFFLGFANKRQRGHRAAHQGRMSYLRSTLKSRQFRLRFRRFRQVLSWPRNLPDSPKLALR